MGKAKRNNFLKGFLSVILTLAMVLPSLLTPAVAFADMITISGTEEHLTSYFVNFVQGNVELTASKFRARDSKGNTKLAQKLFLEYKQIIDNLNYN